MNIAMLAMAALMLIPNKTEACEDMSKKAKKAKAAKETAVVLVLDESGYMIDCKAATMSGFNEYVQSLQKKNEGKMSLTLTRFNTERVKTCHFADIDDVDELTDKNYHPNTGTPLLDAIG